MSHLHVELDREIGKVRLERVGQLDVGCWQLGGFFNGILLLAICSTLIEYHLMLGDFTEEVGGEMSSHGTYANNGRNGEVDRFEVC